MRSAGGYRNRGILKTIDWSLVFCWLILILIGWANIYASVHASEPASIFDFASRSGKQFVWMVTALGIAVFILFIVPPRIYESAALPIYAFVILLLIAVIFLGIEVKGSRSWFEFGPVRFQPAEISKISTSLMLAVFMSQLGYRIGRWKDFIVTALIILVPMLIIVGHIHGGNGYPAFHPYTYSITLCCSSGSGRSRIHVHMSVFRTIQMVAYHMRAPYCPVCIRT